MGVGTTAGASELEPAQDDPGPYEQLRWAAQVWLCCDPTIDNALRQWRWQDVLSTEEQDRTSRIIRPGARRQRIGSLLLRRLLLGSYTGVDPAELRFVNGELGKPELEPNPWRIQFNVTHTGGLLAYVVALDRRCGIDVESSPAEPETVRFGTQRLAPPERERLLLLTPQRRGHGFVDQWVLKEAYTKALGLGMMHHFDRFLLGPCDNGEIMLIDPARAEDELAQWDFLLTWAPTGHRLAVALKRQERDPAPFPVRMRQFPGDLELSQKHRYFTETAVDFSE